MASAISQASKATIPTFSIDHPVQDLKTALDDHGCLIVTGAMSLESIKQLKSELAPFLENAKVDKDDPEAFYPGLTRRVTALASRSSIAQALIMHPVSMALNEHHLAGNCERFQLHATAALEIGPGARTQILHREEDPFNFFELPRPNLVLATMWAVNDFTVENGATCVVPGSHRWSAERTATPEEIAVAEMPAGSVLFWVGGLFHGAGQNISDVWRYGVILSYSCGWLRQEENQYLDVTREALEEMDPELRKILGFTMHGALGFYDPTLK